MRRPLTVSLWKPMRVNTDPDRQVFLATDSYQSVVHIQELAHTSHKKIIMEGNNFSFICKQQLMVGGLF